MTAKDTLAALGLTTETLTGGSLKVTSPIDGATLAEIHETNPAEMPGVIARAKAAFKTWRTVPAPRRGELVRLLGEELRAAAAQARGAATGGKKKVRKG